VTLFPYLGLRTRASARSVPRGWLLLFREMGFGGGISLLILLTTTFVTMAPPLLAAIAFAATSARAEIQNGHIIQSPRYIHTN
jgi:hypothetical protein